MYAATQIQNKIKALKNSRIAQRNSIIFIGPIKSIIIIINNTIIDFMFISIFDLISFKN